MKLFFPKVFRNFFALLLLFVTATLSAQKTYYKFQFTDHIMDQTTFEITKEQLLLKKIKTEELPSKRVTKKDSIIKTIMAYSDLARDENGNYFNPRSHLIEKIGSHFPIENFKNQTGKKFKKNALKGKPSLLNFWFIGCAPCMEEVPYLNSLKTRFEDKVNFIAITFNTKMEVENFLEKTKIPFLHIVDARKPINNLEIISYPTNILLDSKGNILKVYGMLRPSLKKEIEKTLHKLSEK